MQRMKKENLEHIAWIPHVGLIDYTWLFRVGYTVVSMNYL